MSFIMNDTSSRAYHPGWFLSTDKTAIMKTRQIPQAMAVTAADGSKYVPMGKIYPSNDANAVGIVFEDVDVTSGDMPGSVVTSGEVIESRLPDTLDGDAKTALESFGFKFVAEPSEAVRPY